MAATRLMPILLMITMSSLTMIGISIIAAISWPQTFDFTTLVFLESYTLFSQLGCFGIDSLFCNCNPPQSSASFESKTNSA